jgi:hypothetical protein
MRKTLKTILLAGILLSLSIAQAQDTKEAWVPGKVIKLEVKFDGPDASRINMIYGSLSTLAQRPADQAGFSNSIPANGVPISSGIFHLEFTIPETVIPGDYTLSMDVRAPGIQLSYNDGQQFHFHAFHIENHGTFAQPSVTIKEIH